MTTARLPFVALYAGDFLATIAKANLDNETLGIYWRLLLAVYDSREPLPGDPEQLRRRAWVTTPEGQAKLDFVMAEFFERTTHRGAPAWTHRRAAAEIRRATSALERKQEGAANARARLAEQRERERQAQRGTTAPNPPDDPRPEPPPDGDAKLHRNQEAVTSAEIKGLALTSELASGGEPEPEPEPEKRTTPYSPPLLPQRTGKAKAPASPAPVTMTPEQVVEQTGCSPDTVAAWFLARKTRRAGPLTETAWRGLVRNARTAGITAGHAVTLCAENSWQSFQPHYLRNGGTPRAAPPNQPPAWRDQQQQRNRAVLGRFAAAPPSDPTVIEADHDHQTTE